MSKRMAKSPRRWRTALLLLVDDVGTKLSERMRRPDRSGDARHGEREGEKTQLTVYVVMQTCDKIVHYPGGAGEHSVSHSPLHPPKREGPLQES